MNDLDKIRHEAEQKAAQLHDAQIRRKRRGLLRFQRQQRTIFGKMIADMKFRKRNE